MTTTPHIWLALLCFALCPCSCSEAQDGGKPVWVAREDHGDKPGVEYRVWLNADGRMTGEMWLFVIDANGKDKERAKYPITITASDKRSIAFTYKSGDGSTDEIAIRFAAELSKPRMQATLEDVRTNELTELEFKRIDRDQ